MFHRLVYCTFLLIAIVNCEVNYAKCGERLECVEDELIRKVDELDRMEAVPLFGDVLVLSKNGKEAEEVAARGEESLIERCIRYLASHEVKLQIPAATGRSLAIDARSSKIKKIILPLLILLKLKAAIIIPLILSAIALVAFKGLGLSLAALAIAGATGLKNVLDHHHHHKSQLTYEVLPQLAAPAWSRTGMDQIQQQYHPLT